ncbi:MAG TPA: sigma 54-interacting transcriptional regulator [Kofleriaceae bacterium]
MTSGRDTTSEVDASGAARSPALLLVVGDGAISTHALGPADLTIGRAASCDVRLDHPALSRRHAVLRAGPPPTIEDLGSTNGTRVAGVIRRGGAHALRPSDSFHIGPFSFVLVPGAQRCDDGSSSGRDPLCVIDPTLGAVTPLVRDVAVGAANVLILGETGVGKEVLAETLHQLSRRPGPLMRINCAALSESLLESELFGHERGAFTGAIARKPGLLEAAHAGTVFLDEIGELPLATQAKLLRAIEQREVIRLGATRAVAIDARFLAATNRDLPAEVEAGRFRADLFFRLDGVTLAVPPLRERRHMITPLALGFLERLPQPEGPGRLSAEAIAALEAYAWPGNVRELRAVIERARLLARAGDIGARHLVFAHSAGCDAKAVERGPSDPSLVDLSPEQRTERDRIVALLQACAGNQTRTARRLGIPRTTLANRLSVLRIPRPRG